MEGEDQTKSSPLPAMSQSKTSAKARKDIVRQLNNNDDDDEEDLDFVQSPKKQLIVREDASKVLKTLIDSQPPVKFSDIHPRNKAGLTSKSSDLEVQQALGSNYNAHKIRLFTSTQLKELNKSTTFTVSNLSGCHICTNTEKTAATTTASCNVASAAASPRGVELPRKWRSDKTIVVASYQRTHIVLAFNNIMPPTSEHEVSHRCHNPACVNVEHLVWELHPENMAREACRNLRSVKCPNCAHNFAVACPHNPNCV